MGAICSEPALLALGEQVEKLTNGKFSKMKLVLSVAIGVGLGISMGVFPPQSSHDTLPRLLAVFCADLF